MAAMLAEAEVRPERPSFYLLNVGETHYPYALPDEDPSEWPRISGVHGVFKRLDEREPDGGRRSRASSSTRTSCASCASGRSAPSSTSTASSRGCSTVLPDDTWVIVTSDHGELFGEDRYFGHGPIMHEKVFEVPFVEGLAP